MKHRIIHLLILAGLALSHSVTATVYYVDPLQGKMSNPGTAANPWSTLAAVFNASKVFQPGDRIYLRRGNHGTASITGINSGDVFIEAEPGHTPVAGISMINAHHWYIKGLTIPSRVVIDNQTNENSDDNTFENCYMPSGGFAVCGNRITLKGNHIRAGGIHFQFHSNNGLISGNTIEDFYSDAVNFKGNSNRFEYNLILNSHKVDGNHNDLIQCWQGTSGNVIRGNELRVYSDPNQPDVGSGTQGIGCFDGGFTNYVIENNRIFVDHPIGIWMNKAKNCVINNNTIARCGDVGGNPDRPPNINLYNFSSGNIVQNNVAERFELTADGNNGQLPGIVTNNVVISKSNFAATYVDWAHKNVRLKAGASPIDAGTSANSPPSIDADGNARPFGAAWDCGAYEFGYAPASADTTAPSKPAGLSAVTIPGYGVDLHWSASTDNRKVVGYDIYRNGIWLDLPSKPHGGRTRAGTNYFDITATTTGSYTVQAFDHAGNRSPMSDPIVGTPPDPDLTAPTIPANVDATATSMRSIQITWSASCDDFGVGVAGYHVYRDGALVSTLSAIHYADTGLLASTLYSYTIKAYDAAGNISDFSAAASATTLPPDLTPPSVPSDVVATAQSDRSILLTWSASTDDVGVTSYEVFRDGNKVTSVVGTSFLDTSLSASTSFSYTVRAMDDGPNQSAFSEAVSATTFDPDSTPPSVPANLSAVATLNSAIQVTWTAATDNVAVVGYKVFRNGVLVGTVTGTGFLDTGLTASTLYSYTARAFDAENNESPPSGAATATTLEHIPVLAEEEFTYADGPLLGLNGGTGWSGAWTVMNKYDNETARYDVVGGKGRMFSGGNGTDYPWAHRNLTTPISDDAGTYWLAFQLQVPGYHKDSSYTLMGTSVPLISLKTDVTGMSFQFLGGTYHSPGDTNEHLFLIKIQMSGNTNAESASLFYDPDLDSDPGTWVPLRTGSLTMGAGGLTGFRTDSARAGNTGYRTMIDDIRLARTWQGAVQRPGSDGEPPTVPANVIATAQSSTSISITWDASTDNMGVDGYEIYRNGTLVDNPPDNSFTDTGLTPSTLYSYTVKAKDAAGNSSASSMAASATTLPPADTQAPTVPASVVATAQSGSSILITWNASTDNVGVTVYEVYRGTTLVGSPVTTSFTDTGLTASTLYSYTVKAKDAAGNPSSASTSASATTQASGAPGIPVIYQAEGGTFVGLTAATDSPITYLASNTASATVRYVEWNVTASGAGMHELILRYSMGTTPERPMKIEVNGVVVAASYSLPRLSGMNWGAYADSTPLQTSLNAGVNTVRATSLATGNPRLDYLKVTPLAVVNPDGNGNGMPDAWEIIYFGSTSNPQGAADFDWDHDGQNNLHEYLAGTIPTDSASVFKITSVTIDAGRNLVLQWPSVTGKWYGIQTSIDLAAGFHDTADAPIAGTGGILTKSLPVGLIPTGFYRIVAIP